jgi:hypothetical protein
MPKLLRDHFWGDAKTNLRTSCSGWHGAAELIFSLIAGKPAFRKTDLDVFASLSAWIGRPEEVLAARARVAPVCRRSPLICLTHYLGIWFSRRTWEIEKSSDRANTEANSLASSAARGMMAQASLPHHL